VLVIVTLVFIVAFVIVVSGIFVVTV